MEGSHRSDREHYPKAGIKGGFPTYPLETILWFHQMLNWYYPRDPAMEDALIELPTVRRFNGIDLISKRIPNEITIDGKTGASLDATIALQVMAATIFWMIFSNAN
jgi:hypothetical protein